MEKTLYLSENRTLRVSCDGPSLWVEQAGRAGQRVPARLVRRMVVVGNVALDTGSLTLLAARGVPIALFDRQGKPLAMVLGLRDGDQQRRARQAALSEDRERRERIVTWLDAWERGRQCRVLRRLDSAQARVWRRTGFRRSDYEHWILAEGRARGQQVRTRTFFRGLLQELVASEILAAGWDPHAGVRHRGTSLGFVKDCTSALFPDADWLWLTLPEPGLYPAPGMATRTLASHFDAARPQLEGLVRLMLEQYARRLWEI